MMGVLYLIGIDVLARAGGTTSNWASFGQSIADRAIVDRASPLIRIDGLVLLSVLLRIGHWQEETMRIVHESPESEVLAKRAGLIVLGIDNDGHRADIPAGVGGTDECVSKQPSAQSASAILQIDGKPTYQRGRQRPARQPSC